MENEVVPQNIFIVDDLKFTVVASYEDDSIVAFLHEKNGTGTRNCRVYDKRLCDAVMVAATLLNSGNDYRIEAVIDSSSSPHKLTHMYFNRFHAA